MKLNLGENVEESKDEVRYEEVNDKVIEDKVISEEVVDLEVKEEENSNEESFLEGLINEFDFNDRNGRNINNARYIINELQEGYEELEDYLDKSNHLSIIVSLYIFLNDNDDEGNEFAKNEIVEKIKVKKALVNNFFKSNSKKYVEFKKQKYREEMLSRSNCKIGSMIDCPNDISDLIIMEGYEVRKDGIYKYDKENEMYRLMFNDLFFISKRIINPEDNSILLELIFKDGFEWKRLLVDREEIMNHNKIIGLAKYDFSVTSTNARNKSVFLSDFERVNKPFLVEKKLITNIGWDVDEKKLITQNGIFDGVKVIDDGESYFDNRRLTNMIFNIEENNDLNTFEEAIRNFLTLNHIEITLPIISWFLTSIMSPFVRTHEIMDTQFPLLNVWGTKGSGKSATVDMIREIFGLKEDLKTFSTSFSMLYQFSRTNAIPTIYDEYLPVEMNPRILNDFHQNAKNAYRMLTTEKGNKMMNVNSFKLIRPICFIGEDTPNNDAIKDRTLVVKIQNSKIEDEKYLKSYQNLLKLDRTKVAYHIWKFIHHYINTKAFDDNIRQSYAVANKYFSHLSTRAKINTTVLIIGANALNEMFKFYNLEANLFSGEDIIKVGNYTNKHLVEERNNLTDKVFEFFSANFYRLHNYKEKMKVVTDDKKNLHLYVQSSALKGFLDDYSERFKFKYTKNMFEVTLKDEVNDDRSYILSIKKQSRLGTNKNNSRCIVVDLIKLSEQTEIDLSYWEDFFEEDEEVMEKIKKDLMD